MMPINSLETRERICICAYRKAISNCFSCTFCSVVEYCYIFNSYDLSSTVLTLLFSYATMPPMFSRAPEVLMSRPYNERVDVYSFGIILYELFSKRLVSSDFINTMEYDESEIFAQKAASGYRPPFPLRMPQEIRDIVNKCWSGVPELRPKMMDVVRDLRAIRSGGSMEELDKAFALKHQEGCCIIV